MDKQEAISEAVRRLFASRDKSISEEVLEVFCEELDGYDPRVVIRAIKRAIRAGGPFITDIEKIIDFVEEEQNRPRTPEEIFSEKKAFMALLAAERGLQIKGLEDEIKKIQGGNHVQRITESKSGENT